jgi:hypothetical protein
VVEIVHIPSENAYMFNGENASGLNYKVLENGRAKM